MDDFTAQDTLFLRELGCVDPDSALRDAVAENKQLRIDLTWERKISRHAMDATLRCVSLATQLAQTEAERDAMQKENGRLALISLGLLCVIIVCVGIICHQQNRIDLFLVKPVASAHPAAISATPAAGSFQGGIVRWGEER